jgi:CPA2 family monovalent cation:H+ antiporter-2
MSAIAPLISDLALILVVAGISTLIFKWLHQPVILGYIVAGLLAGPAVPNLPTVTESSSIHVWADIGVIFLLFAMGLEFSFRKLINVGGTAIAAATTIVAGMMFLGYGTGALLGFSHMSSLFLGGMLSMSSTAIVFKAFDDMGLRGQRFTSVVMGILVVEDLVGVVLMVLLSTLAVSKQFEGMQMLESVLKLVAFLIFWSLLGIYLVPSFLRRAQRLLNDETLLIVALGLCLGMVMVAIKAGFSSALGAFVMGSILSETVVSERIIRLTEPVKNLFGAIFFVSVGMMINPTMLLHHLGPIALLTLLVLVGQSLFGSLGVLISGQPLRTAIQSGFSLTQVGEFAFIIATLGTTLHVTDDSLYPIIVAVSVITTFLTPYMIRSANPCCDWLERRMSSKWQELLARYASGAGTERHPNTWLRLLRRMLLPVGICLIFCIFVETAFMHYVTPHICRHIPGRWGALICLGLLLSILAPILLTIIRQGNHSPEFRRLWSDSKFNRGPLVSLILLKCLVCLGVLMSVVVSLFNTASGIGFTIALVLFAGIVLSKRLHRRSLAMEHRLRANFGEETERPHTAPDALNAEALPFETFHLAEFTVATDSVVAGRSLHQINFRNHYGVTVVAIQRGDKQLQLPDGDTILFPHDRITVAGTDEEFRKFRRILEEQRATHRQQHNEPHPVHPRIESFTLPEHTALEGTSIRESQIRDHAMALILGIVRGGVATLNPGADEQFHAGDVVWAVGDPVRMANFFRATKREA